MGVLEFCEQFIWLKQKPISFAGRNYLPEIYAAASQRNLVLRCSRQVEKSTLLVNLIIYNAVVFPGIQLLLVCPRAEQAGVLSKFRLLPTIEGSPLIRRVLLGANRHRQQVMNYRFANDTQLFVRAAYRTADAVRGVSADVLLIDEYQDVAAGDLPVMQEAMSHSDRGQIVICGTPKLVTNHLENVFRMSTANEWLVPCQNCQQDALLDERVLGPHGLICPICAQSIDPRQGRWVPRNPGSIWGSGYWVNHLCVPWLNADKVIERRGSYDPARFRNECLGMPTQLGDHVVSREQMEACCGDYPLARNLFEATYEGQGQLIAGIDWGGGGVAATVLVIGYIRPDMKFVIVYLERFAGRESPDLVLQEVAQRCRAFQVQVIAADGGGNGHIWNRMLLNLLDYRPAYYAILYSASDQAPFQDGQLWKWTVNRSSSIGTLFARIKKRLMVFPQVADCGSFLDEFVCELVEYNDLSRTIKYSHPPTHPDDTLHATNYAQLVALRKVHLQNYS